MNLGLTADTLIKEKGMVKEYPLQGVRTYELNILPDERGFLLRL
jgi:dTDP-4-dehydrorhamnose 3,5-epimerase-like enzyme